MYEKIVISVEGIESKQQCFSPISISNDVKFNNAQVHWPVAEQGHSYLNNAGVLRGYRLF